MFVIKTSNLTKEFNGLKAVNNLNLKINQGEIFDLLGPNGAGKTTFISPQWLRTISYFNPITYGVDSLRHIMIDTSLFPFSLSFTAISLFSLIAILIGATTFNRQK